MAVSPGDVGRVPALSGQVEVVAVYDNKLWVRDPVANQMATVHVGDFKAKKKGPRRFLHGRNNIDCIELTNEVFTALNNAGISIEPLDVAE